GTLRSRGQGARGAARMKLRFGTRGSRLAVVQSTEVADALRALGHEVELVTIRTSGDRLADVALADFGGKALFVKEIEEARRVGRAGGGVTLPKAPPRRAARRPLSRSLLRASGSARVPSPARGRRPRRSPAWGAGRHVEPRAACADPRAPTRSPRRADTGQR